MVKDEGGGDGDKDGVEVRVIVLSGGIDLPVGLGLGWCGVVWLVLVGMFCDGGNSWKAWCSIATEVFRRAQ